MSHHLISIYLLAGLFVIATVWPINMGVLAFVGAFLIGTLLVGMKASEIIDFFPGGLFLTLAGITWLFALAQNNGTIDWLVRLAVRAVKGRIAAIPWIMFGISALLTSVGAVSPGAVAIIAPIALGFAFRYHISPMLMGLMVVHGAQAGGFSPISIYGGITNGVVSQAGLPLSPMTTFAASFFVNFAVALILFMVLGGRRLLRAGSAEITPVNVPHLEIARPATGPQIFGDSEAEALTRRIADEASGEPNSLLADPTAPEPQDGTPYQIATLAGLAALAVLVLAFKQDIGFISLTIGLVLSLWSPTLQKRAMAQVAWPEIMLITGVSTYVSVMEHMGTIDFVGDSVAGLASPLLAALLLFYIGAVVSAFASSVAVLGSLIPLAVPFLQAGTGVSAIGFIAGMAVASTIVDVSPFSTNGALVLANAQGVDRQAFFRRLLGYGALVTLIAPPVLWLIFVVLPG
ncbi:SLC13 family permease [Paracoccus sulfuroxidans]|uniref:Dicarboxylate carrier protein MatC n=1 Tax=Paracoccus sulfuroxidans TaxID=384678 RepID=A0A562NYI1_9RHOB|nr:SLC13 family permease [Paracoccus sulfuroxidans]TWI37141.1 dicarboxylate carrier protein MatC [Paracoccus sulfuroxidans]